MSFSTTAAINAETCMSLGISSTSRSPGFPGLHPVTELFLDLGTNLPGRTRRSGRLAPPPLFVPTPFSALGPSALGAPVASTSAAAVTDPAARAFTASVPALEGKRLASIVAVPERGTASTCVASSCIDAGTNLVISFSFFPTAAELTSAPSPASPPPPPPQTRSSPPPSLASPLLPTPPTPLPVSPAIAVRAPVCAHADAALQHGHAPRRNTEVLLRLRPTCACTHIRARLEEGRGPAEPWPPRRGQPHRMSLRCGPPSASFIHALNHPHLVPHACVARPSFKSYCSRDEYIPLSDTNDCRAASSVRGASFRSEPAGSAGYGNKRSQEVVGINVKKEVGVN
ncbi:hypothetical protein DFH09DRAFT_1317818 [Mycena vulgaris]|nr:hypothetical protein DFH09DRAFT_1317818 [Mycena vulgaris]